MTCLARFAAAMEARSTAAEQSTASANNGKIDPPSITYHSFGVQSYSSQAKQTADLERNLLLASDPAATRPIEIMTSSDSDGRCVATREEGPSHRQSRDSKTEPPQAVQARRVPLLAGASPSVKPSKISALCPECDEEAFGLMVAILIHHL
jgi:hypothetical protein